LLTYILSNVTRIIFVMSRNIINMGENRSNKNADIYGKKPMEMGGDG